MLCMLYGPWWGPHMQVRYAVLSAVAFLSCRVLTCAHVLHISTPSVFILQLYLQLVSVPYRSGTPSLYLVLVPRLPDVRPASRPPQEVARKRRQAADSSSAAAAASTVATTTAVGGEVGESDIASVISSWTGIPLTKLVASERDSLLRLGDELHRWVRHM